MTRASSLRWNLAANFVGQGWRALMALLFVPFYVRILGVEAYGLIGLYISLQLALALLDAGLRPTLAREMARFTGGAMDPDAIRTLLRSVELPLLALSGTIALIMLVAAPWLTAHWVQPDRLHPDTVTQAFRVMGLVAALQFLESAYDSCLSGLQRQVLLNVIVTAIATLRGFGALVVLWIVPQLTAFFAWQAAVALLSCVLLGAAVYRSLPAAKDAIRFSSTALRSIRGYAAGMFGIAVLSLLLTQSDKVVLARFRPLADVGHYTLAATLVGAIAMLSGPIGNAFFPRLTQLRESGDAAALAATFHRLSGLMATIVGAAASLLILFGERILDAWLHDPGLSSVTAPILTFLALAALFSTLTSLPYLLQLANGVTAIALKINVVLLVLFAPALIIMAASFGSVGAAVCAAALSLAGMTANAVITLRRFLPEGQLRWWLGDVGCPLIAIFAAAFLLSKAMPRGSSALEDVILLGASGAVILVAGLVASPALRSDIRATLARRTVSSSSRTST